MIEKDKKTSNFITINAQSSASFGSPLRPVAVKDSVKPVFLNRLS
ncbi:hypothetical protein [Oscillibacter sp. GMB15532]